jgi:hypothetical protein
MKLGLIGTGKQGQRYLLEKNGGRHITVSGSRRIPLDDVDGVIIATHPAGHKELALECIAAGKPVLVEKPLALNLRDCMDIIDAAEKSPLPDMLEVAHTHCWSYGWIGQLDSVSTLNEAYPFGVVVYTEHHRDYSPWLDWAPHLLALFAGNDTTLTTSQLREICSVSKGDRRVFLAGATWRTDGGDLRSAVYDGTRMPEPDQEWGTPMRYMVEEFTEGDLGGDKYNQLRRVYRALFAEE